MNFRKQILPTVAAACLGLTSTAAFGAIIDGTDFTTTPGTAYTVSSIDLTTPISGEDSVYITFTVDSNYDTIVNQNGFDLLEIRNSDDSNFAGVGESGAANTTWNSIGVISGSVGTTETQPDFTGVIRIDQVAEEAFFYVNPNLAALESANTATLTSTSFGVLTNDIDIVQFRGGGGNPNTLAWSDIALYTGSDTPFAIPEPGSLALLGLGLVGLSVFFLRRRKR